MATYNYKPGLGLTAAYQVSGIPYAKGPLEDAPAGGGPHKLKFPAVTKFVAITNTDGSGNEVQLGFSANGLSNFTNAFVVPDGQTLTLDLKLTELYYTGSASSFGVLAGLTFIGTDQIDNPGLSPSGSNWSGSLNANVG